MKKIINFLLNKNLLLIIASIMALLLTLSIVIIYFDGFVFYWDDYFWFAFFIALILTAPYYIPALVSNLIDIHQNNLEDIKEQELEKAK
jgi:DMSO reductase anchor subunit